MQRIVHVNYPQFEGRVHSLQICEDGPNGDIPITSNSQMLPGNYDFGTAEVAEELKVLSGQMIINGVAYNRFSPSCQIKAGTPMNVYTANPAAWFTIFYPATPAA